MSDVIIPEGKFITPQSAEYSYKSLKALLNKLRMRSQLLNYTSGILLWLASILLLLMGWFLLGGVLRIPGILRAILMVIWAGCAVWSAYTFIISKLIRGISLEQIAFRIEQNHPEMQDRLISSLQLWRELPENKYGYSENFIRMVVEEARILIDKIDKAKLFDNDIKKFNSSVLVMICSLLPFIVIIAVFPATFGHSLYTFAHPFESETQLNYIAINSITPGNLTIHSGGDVEITADITHQTPLSPFLYYKTAESEWKNMGMIQKTAETLKNPEELNPHIQKAKFTAKLNNIRESMEYYVSAGEIESQKYLINVVQRPIIGSIKVELQYPRYTGSPNQSLDENTGDITAPLGTKVIMEAKSSKDVASAFLMFDDDTKTRLDVHDSKTLKGSFIINQSGKYYISVTDTEDQSNSDPIKYSINAVLDQPPQVDIIYPGENVTLNQDMTIPLQISAQDDYGVAEIKLHYEIVGQDKEDTIPLGKFGNQQADVLLKHVWNLNPLQLFPEDVVSYYAEASDHDNVSGPNIGKSKVFTARYPSLYEIYKQTEREQQAQEEEMEEILSQQEAVKETVDEVVKELRKEKELDWADKKELERAEELQKKIEQQMKNLVQQINETSKKIEENPFIEMKIFEKMQELRNLINELANDEMKQVMNKLSEALQEINSSKQEQDLSSLSQKQEELIQKLDRMIDLFKNMRMKQKLDAVVNQAKELVRQQTETLENSEQLAKTGINSDEEKSKSRQLGEREMRIKNQFEQLQGELDEIAEEMGERIPDMGKLMEKISERTKQEQIPDKLQRAGKELSDSKPVKSIPFQKNALSAMSQLQAELQEASESMEGQDASRMIAELRDAAQKSLYLSHRHEKILNSIKPLNTEYEKMLPKEKEIIDSLASDQLDLADGVKKVAEQLKALSHETLTVSPEMVWRLERSADGMRRSARAMEDKLPVLAEPIQKNVLASLNKAIDDMLESIDQISSQSIPMMGMEEYMEQLRQLAGQQSQLNQSTQDSAESMRRQGRPPSLDDLLEKLAMEQSLIREAAERLAAKLDKLAETMGSLQEVAREMQEVEGALRSGNLGRNTIDKQKRILTRLLDYEKSLRKQDYDRKREAQTGRDYMVEKPKSELPDEATNIRKQLDTMLTPSAQEKWPLRYRDLIKMYYKALSNTIRTPNREAK